MATLDEVARHGEINRHYPMLARAALSVGSPQIRHRRRSEETFVSTAGAGSSITLRSGGRVSECRKASEGSDAMSFKDPQKAVLPSNPETQWDL
jgi:hypothetical protein